MGKITIRVESNALGQILESAAARADELEETIENLDVESAIDTQKTIQFIRDSVAHVDTAMDNAKLLQSDAFTPNADIRAGNKAARGKQKRSR